MKKKYEENEFDWVKVLHIYTCSKKSQCNLINLIKSFKTIEQICFYFNLSILLVFFFFSCQLMQTIGMTF